MKREIIKILEIQNFQFILVDGNFFSLHLVRIYKINCSPCNVAFLKKFSELSKLICCKGEAEFSIPLRLSGRNVPSNVI